MSPKPPPSKATGGAADPNKRAATGKPGPGAADHYALDAAKHPHYREEIVNSPVTVPLPRSVRVERVRITLEDLPVNLPEGWHTVYFDDLGRWMHETDVATLLGVMTHAERVQFLKDNMRT
jgi:hypothetical protein